MACSKNSISGGAVNDTNLCEDLLVEILTKLPPKSFFRSKCVSKAWHRLICDDHVQRKLPFTISGIFHRCNAKPNCELNYACMSDGEFTDCNLSFFPFLSDSRIISCCNGLLLFSCRLPPAFHVCNTVTKRWFTLPSPRKESLLPVLVFDPCLSPHYKVICFTGWQAQGADLEVFSSEAGNWVELSVHWGVESGTMSAVMNYFDGILHIVSYPQHIVGVDVERMTCHHIELPEQVRSEACVGKSGGRLQYYTGIDGGELRIWMLEDLDKSVWVLKHCISSRAIIEQQFQRINSSCSSFSFGRQLRFLAFHPALEVVYLWVAGKLLSFDMSKKRFEEVWEFGTEEGGYLVQIWIFPFSRSMLHCLGNV